MKQSGITLLLVMFMSMLGVQVLAHDIEVANEDGIVIYYNWINGNTELAVSCRGNAYDDYPNEYSGNVVIPETVEYGGKTVRVTSIGEDAFYDCMGVISVIIPNSVKIIEGGAFRWCMGMTSVNIPNSIVTIDGGAFYMCSNLTSLYIPKSVTSIGEEAFSYCGVLSSIKVENGNPNYDSRGDCNAIIETKTNKLIVGCKNSKIPNSVTSIGSHVFHWCSGMTSLTIPNSVTAIGDWCFTGCSGLTSATIPNSVKTIGYGIFSDCRNLTSVTIPGSVTSFGDWAFSRCPALATIYVQAKEPVQFESGGSNAFGTDNFQQATVYVPIGSNSKYEAADVWKKFSRIEEMETILPDDNGDGNVINPDKAELKVWLADGQVVAISLEEEPKTTYTDGKLFIKTSKETITYPLEEVRKFTYVLPKLPGDADGNGVVNEADVVEVSNKIMGKPSAKFVEANADVNGDGKVNAVDIVLIVTMLTQ